MHFLFYSPITLPSVGGLQYVIHFWATELMLRGYQVTVISETAASENAAVEQASAEKPPYPVHRFLTTLQKKALLAEADTLLMFDVALKALPFWWGSGKPLYVSHQSGLWYEGQRVPFRQKLKQWFANTWVTHNIACSKYIAVNYRPCTVVYNPIDVQVFKTDTSIMRQQAILFVGRLVTDKGCDLLLAAFHQLTKEEEYKKYALWIAGDGPERERLQLQANSIGIADQIIWWGMLPQREVVLRMQKAAVMVVPSRIEPMGMVAVEGLACGCTMVVSQTGGLIESGGAFCHYFKPGSVTDLTYVIKQALENPGVFNHQALQEHLQQFTIGHSVDQLVKVLVPAK